MKPLIAVVMVIMASTVVGAGDPDALFMEAVQTYNRGDLKTAHALFADYLLEYPHDFLAQEYQGILELQLGRLDKARIHFVRVLEKRPESIKALVGMGHVECAKGTGFAGQEYYEKAAKLSPTQEIRALVRHAREANKQRVAVENEQKRIRFWTAFNSAVNNAAADWAWRQAKDAEERLKHLKELEKAAASAPQVDVQVPAPAVTVNVYRGR